VQQRATAEEPVTSPFGGGFAGRANDVFNGPAGSPSVGLADGEAGAHASRARPDWAWAEYTSTATSLAPIDVSIGHTIYSPVTALTYPEGNYAFTLPNWEDANATVRQRLFALNATNFVDLRTRAVFFDVNVYNPSIDSFSSLKFIAELRPGGGVLTSARIKTMRLYRSHQPGDRVRMCCEFVVLLFVLSWLRQELAHVRRKRLLPYLLDVPRWGHMLNVYLFVVVFALKGCASLWAPARIDVGSEQFVSIEACLWAWEWSQELNAFNCFLSWMRCFHFLGYIPMYRLLLGVMQRAASPVLSFSFVSCWRVALLCRRRGRRRCVPLLAVRGAIDSIGTPR
jgi:hypothetical protein